MNDTCPGHETVTDELRGLAIALLDRLQPALERAQAAAAATQPAGSTCPLCVLLSTLRGERPDLVARVARHAAGVVAVLRTALDEGSDERSTDGAARTAPTEPTPATADAGAASRTVQRIPVERHRHGVRR